MNKVQLLEDYQKQAMKTCTDSSNNFSYMMLNLVGEVGELASKVAKAVRKEKAVIDSNHLITERGCKEMSDEEIRDMKAEAGDILWQLSGLCTVMGWSLKDVANENLQKLASRQDRGVIVGDGDNR
ncbi:nucleoside triphosphate pyrophosphohydrolase family protein [Prevotella sp. E2-28]|uniref:nucleoside triphosphate pyrophosphohydrolase family protein n=1 Tax=Prevotella sp. E2-28 TaxID=2913620 RepID=UPI001EDBA7AC|nr:nucleoside triphosphate pyrophosphohydrolase family protein [Prevotella sp. E2-28]UKK52684.1 nucleoside triphosphate pyrophosphohydrolase family protein [Prevotella sp. E2-28]